MQLLDRILPTRRIPAAIPPGLWEFRTARKDIPCAYISPDMRSGFAVFADSPHKLRRLSRRQLRSLLANDHSRFLRPERLN